MTAEEQMVSIMKSKNILVVVPHEDDEINVAGSLLYQLKGKARCHVVYFTNGECFVTAKRRIKEAQKALKVLGVRKDDILFLGYPDVSEIDDRCTYISGDHKREACVKDLIDVICKIKPDYIIVNEFDDHVNHKELSLLVDEAVHVIKNDEKYSNYTPLLMKTPAYSMAYFATDDYTSYNLKSTVNSGDDDWNPIIMWKNRLRLPVPKEARTNRITNNVLFRALWRHHSQTAYKCATRIANADKVYWCKRTDGLQFLSKISVSSGEKKYLNDFSFFCVDDRLNPDYTKLWIPDASDEQKTVRIELKSSRKIEEIVLYENPLPGQNIDELLIRLSNGYTKIVDDIRHDGKMTVVNIDSDKCVEWVELSLKKTSGELAGLTEIEIYQLQEAKFWFAKLCMNQNYVYDYVRESEAKVTIEAYDTNGRRMQMSEDKIHISCVINNQELEIELCDSWEAVSSVILRHDDYDEPLDCINILKKEKSPKCLKNLYKIEKVGYDSIDWLINEYYRIPILLKKILGC